jgi:hypothetical protein
MQNKKKKKKKILALPGVSHVGHRITASLIDEGNAFADRKKD